MNWSLIQVMVKIGNLALGKFPLLLAPMEDVSDPPFRAVCKVSWRGSDVHGIYLF